LAAVRREEASARSYREPPTWMPAVAIGSIPLAIATVAGVGLTGSGWALGAALMAVFFGVLLFALWATPTTTKGFAAATLIAGSAAIVLTVTLVRLTAVADRLDVTRPGNVRVDPEPVKVLLQIADLEGTALCLASHERVPPAAKLMHSVRSALIERAQHPLVVVGANASTEWLGSDVVVALDGVGNAERLLAVAAAWALALHSRLRIVTVYEPVLSDLRRPEHFSRRHGPPGDPDVYLSSMRGRVAEVGLAGVNSVAIPDAVSVRAGLEHHLANAPARLLLLGGGHRGVSLSAGVARSVLDNATLPVLIVPVPSPPKGALCWEPSTATSNRSRPMMRS
jgi:nucleotide-binding universal stress UspA family protein